MNHMELVIYRYWDLLQLFNGNNFVGFNTYKCMLSCHLRCIDFSGLHRENETCAQFFNCKYNAFSISIIVLIHTNACSNDIWDVLMFLVCTGRRRIMPNFSLDIDMPRLYYNNCYNIPHLTPFFQEAVIYEELVLKTNMQMFLHFGIWDVLLLNFVGGDKYPLFSAIFRLWNGFQIKKTNTMT